MENVAFKLPSDGPEGTKQVQRAGAVGKKRGREDMENDSLPAVVNLASFKRPKNCCRTCEGFGWIGFPNISRLNQLNGEPPAKRAIFRSEEPPAKRSKIEKNGVVKSEWVTVTVPGHFRGGIKYCCTTCEGLGGIGLPPQKYLEQAERAIKLQTPTKYIEWLEERSEARKSSEVGDDVIQSPSWWYAQVCLACTKTVQHCSLHGHLHGIQHRKVVTRNGLRPNWTRKIPMLVYPGNFESNMMDQRYWGDLVWPLDVLPKDKFMDSVAELHEGLRCLVLGEQDFSFSNTVGSIVGGKNVVGTCYLSKHDPRVPDVKTLNDGERRFHHQKSLGSMDGDLYENLTLADQTGVSIRYNVDAQNIQGTLLDKESIEIKQFDRIIFPFPRVSLIRGCDPNNSVLIKKFLNSAKDVRCLAQEGLVQLIMLENQFREWDIPHIAEEAGFQIRGLGWMNFVTLPYQARDVTGKRIRSAAMHDKTLYISFARDPKPVLSKI